MTTTAENPSTNHDTYIPTHDHEITAWNNALGRRRTVGHPSMGARALGKRRHFGVLFRGRERHGTPRYGGTKSLGYCRVLFGHRVFVPGDIHHTRRRHRPLRHCAAGYSLPIFARRTGRQVWSTAVGNQSRPLLRLRKVEPNERALAGKSAWIAGLRRDQSDTRQGILPVQWDEKFGLYKICPLWNWSEDQVNNYIQANDVPINPLHAQGYTSIGCTHCTRANKDGGNLRGGRWAGTDKTECGLHK